jgi:hypothetical protein
MWMFWIEDEFRVVNIDWEVITNLGDWKREYDILNVFNRKLLESSITWVSLVPELDAAQWEIIVDASDSIRKVSDLLAETLLLFEEYLKGFGARFDENVWIPNQLETLLSTELYPDLVNSENTEKYKLIDSKLKQLLVREHTNIIWMHLNISESDRSLAIEKNIRIWKYIKETLTNWKYNQLGISKSRFESYVKVTDALNIAYMPIIEEKRLLWLNWIPIDNYTLNRLRMYPNWDLWSELRFPDAITSSAAVHDVVNNIYSLYR